MLQVINCLATLFFHTLKELTNKQFGVKSKESVSL